MSSRPARLLDRYAGTDNLERAQVVAESAAAPAGGRRRAGEVAPGLSVAVLTLDRPDLIIPLIERLSGAAAAFAEHGLGFELLIGDTGSTDPAVLAAYADLAQPAAGGVGGIRVVRDLDYHFSRCNNAVLAAAAEHELFMLLNNDVILPGPEALLGMVRCFDDPTLGVIGLALDFPDGSVQHRRVEFIEGGNHHLMPYHAGAGEPSIHAVGTEAPAIAVTGAALMIRAELWRSLGGLDEEYASECQDIDLCLAVRRLGRRVASYDAGPIVHLENATRPRGDVSASDRRLWLRRWQGFLESDLVWVPARLAAAR